MHTITLNKKNLKRFSKVFDNILYLDILDIDITIIDSIKTKLKLASIKLKESNSNSQTLTFSTTELRVLKKLSIDYISYKKNYQISNNNGSNFSSYLKKIQGENYDKWNIKRGILQYSRTL